jgi:hypothetical protein
MKMRDNGELEELNYKWWKTESLKQRKPCNLEILKNPSKLSLSIKHIGGIFLILAGFLILAILVVFLESKCKKI